MATIYFDKISKQTIYLENLLTPHKNQMDAPLRLLCDRAVIANEFTPYTYTRVMICVNHTLCVNNKTVTIYRITERKGVAKQY